MNEPTLRQRLRYAFDNTMARGTSALVFWLVVASAAGKWPFLLMMLLLTIGGLLIVSALIGVLATGLDRKIEELRKGRSVVLERDHTLILGWSETIFTILAELEIANASEKDPSVVILADHDRVEMEDAIRAKVRGGGTTRIVCRTGSPVDLSDLQIASPQTARSVIVLSPDGEDDPDAQVIKAILALTRSPGRREHPYRIVAEIHDPANMEAARLVGGEEAVLVDKRETISRLLVQASRQSGASVVYNELLDFGGDEVYFRADDALVGRSFGDALLAYDDCSVIGLRRTTDRRTLDSLGVERFDHVVVMCYSEQLDHQRADARTLVTLLHLRDIVARGDARVTITSEMLDDRNRELAQVTKVDDVIVSDRVLSLMLTQLSENENLAGVFGELFAAEGSEIYLRPAGDYVALGRGPASGAVVEPPRRRREIAVGYRMRQGEDDPSEAGFEINPSKSARLSFDEDDRVIVLAEE